MKTKKTKQKKTGRVTHLSVERLYNLDTYQNVKYSLSAEVLKGESPSETLVHLFRVIAQLAPLRQPESIHSLNHARAKKLSERSNYEKEHFSQWLEEERQFKQKVQARLDAILSLDRMGGSSTLKDHKLDWGDQDVPW